MPPRPSFAARALRACSVGAEVSTRPAEVETLGIPAGRAALAACEPERPSNTTSPTATTRARIAPATIPRAVPTPAQALTEGDGAGPLGSKSGELPQGPQVTPKTLEHARCASFQPTAPGLHSIRGNGPHALRPDAGRLSPVDAACGPCGVARRVRAGAARGPVRGHRGACRSGQSAD